jgi:hypothetical protein
VYGNVYRFAVNVYGLAAIHVSSSHDDGTIGVGVGIGIAIEGQRLSSISIPIAFFWIIP